MSIVLSVCAENFSLMMSDSRMIRINNYGETQIVSENFQKIKVINKNVCIGFTGDPFACIAALSELDCYQKDFLTLERTKGIVIRKLKELDINNLGVKMIFSGRNRKNIFTTYSIDTLKNFDEQKYEILHKNNMAIMSALPPYESDMQEVIQKHLHNTMPWNSIDELKKHMRKCIIEVSTLTNSVNRNIQEEMII